MTTNKKPATATLIADALHAKFDNPFSYRGMSDASAAAALGPDLFVVANDERNQLKVYQRGQAFDVEGVRRFRCHAGCLGQRVFFHLLGCDHGVEHLGVGLADRFEVRFALDCVGGEEAEAALLHFAFLVAAVRGDPVDAFADGGRAFQVRFLVRLGAEEAGPVSYTHLTLPTKA